MHKLFIISLIALFCVSCRDTCDGVECAACPPLESNKTILFVFDSTLFDSVLLYKKSTSLDSTYFTVRLSMFDYTLPYREVRNWEGVVSADGKRRWTIGETSFYLTKEDNCCGCTKESITQIMINDSIYKRNQLPLIIK